MPLPVRSLIGLGMKLQIMPCFRAIALAAILKRI